MNSSHPKGKVTFMRKPRGASRYVSVFILMALTGIVGSPPPVKADLMGALVPAYFYPATGGNDPGWTALDTAAHKIPVTAIFNPDSGPLPGPADPNYKAVLTNLESAGGKVVAYVPTGFGTASISTVEGDISTYITQYGGLIKGFFLDQMEILPATPGTPGTPGTLSYYQSIYNYITTLKGSYTVIGNPGSPFLNGVSPQDFLSTANIMNIFEGPNTAPSLGAPGYNTYPYGLDWFLSPNYPSNRFSNIVYDVPADAGNASTSSAMLADLSKALKLNAGYVYMTNLTGGNPYDALPSYWDQEVAAIKAINAVPEPGSVTIVALSWMLVAPGIAVRAWVRRRARPKTL